MSKKCKNCNLTNFQKAVYCVRCHEKLGNIIVESQKSSSEQSLTRIMLKRACVLFAMCLFTVAGFYISLVVSAKPLSYQQKTTIKNSIKILEERGFSEEVFYLRYLTVYRASDHWLNAAVIKEAAYAATNYPFEIMTIYPDFFKYTIDDVERAAILLHEARHLQGEGEKEAYKFVWQNRKKIGWTKEKYSRSIVWKSVRKLTKEYAPELFVCESNDYGDCTESF